MNMVLFTSVLMFSDSVSPRLSRNSFTFNGFHIISWLGNGGSSLKSPFTERHSNDVWPDGVPLTLMLLDISFRIILSRMYLIPCSFFITKNSSLTFRDGLSRSAGSSLQNDYHFRRAFWYFCLFHLLHVFKILLVAGFELISFCIDFLMSCMLKAYIFPQIVYHAGGLDSEGIPIGW